MQPTATRVLEKLWGKGPDGKLIMIVVAAVYSKFPEEKEIARIVRTSDGRKAEKLSDTEYQIKGGDKLAIQQVAA